MSTNARKPFFRTEPSCYAIRRGRHPGGPIKLGYTNQMHTRYKNLQLRFPEMLIFLAVFPGTFQLEKKLHKAFDRIRISPDCEWFLDTDPAKQLEFDKFCTLMHTDDQYRASMLIEIEAERFVW